MYKKVKQKFSLFYQSHSLFRFEWGGCSEDLRFGEYFSKEFVDARERPNTSAGLMNLHNNEAGRRALRSQMEMLCKCHGVSGSCSVRVCWRKLAAFRNTGNMLRDRFDGAVNVRCVIVDAAV